MAAPAPRPSESTQVQLQALGEQLRARRKALRVSATAAAEAAGVSRVTLHRIENGQPSVTLGAWCNVMAALGLTLKAQEPAAAIQRPTEDAGWIPARILLADYPQLKSLAWQVHGTDAITPPEALDIYERNARHLDMQAMSPREQALLAALRVALASGRAYV